MSSLPGRASTAGGKRGNRRDHPHRRRRVRLRLFAAAEVLDNVHAGKPAATGARQAETLLDDAKVFTLRVFGAIAIASGLLSFVFANHQSIF
jgi:hypothetical protein